MKAVIAAVEMNNGIYSVTYESGTVRRYESVPKSVQEWLESISNEAEGNADEVMEAEPTNCEGGCEEELTEAKSVNDDHAPEEDNEFFSPAVVHGELAEIEMAEVANLESMKEISENVTGAIKVVGCVVGVLATIAPLALEIASQGLMGLLFAILVGFKMAVKGGGVAVRLVLGVSGAIADFGIGAFYFLTSIPAVIHGVYSWARWEALPWVSETACGLGRGVQQDALALWSVVLAVFGLVAETMVSGWNLRCSIIAEEKEAMA